MTASIYPLFKSCDANTVHSFSVSVTLTLFSWVVALCAKPFRVAAHSTEHSIGEYTIKLSPKGHGMVSNSSHLKTFSCFLVLQSPNNVTWLMMLISL